MVPRAGSRGARALSFDIRRELARFFEAEMTRREEVHGIAFPRVRDASTPDNVVFWALRNHVTRGNLPFT